jgi:hypothetical protein
MDVSERIAFQEIYLFYLRGRDGTPALDTRTFSGREKRFLQLEGRLLPPPALGLSAEVFQRNLLREKPEPGLEPRMLWALAMAKISRSERYGVDYKLKTCGFAIAVDNDPHLYVELEELYHSRIITLALRHLGLDAQLRPPSRITQLALRMMMLLPHTISDVIVMSAEVAGVIVFRLLAEKARELFQEAPEALSNILELLAQLLIDEVGHVYYLRSRLDGPRLFLARLILPLVARALLDDTPEIWPLLGRERLMKEILAADIPAAVAAFPDRSAPLPLSAPDRSRFPSSPGPLSQPLGI